MEKGLLAHTNQLFFRMFFMLALTKRLHKGRENSTDNGAAAVAATRVTRIAIYFAAASHMAVTDRVIASPTALRANVLHVLRKR
jgi:hypothetical protein